MLVSFDFAEKKFFKKLAFPEIHYLELKRSVKFARKKFGEWGSWHFFYSANLAISCNCEILLSSGSIAYHCNKIQ